MMSRGRGRRTGVRRLGDTAGLGTPPRAGTARGTWPGPLALSPEPSRRDDWCLGESWRLSSPCLRLRSGLLDLRRSDPWELGRPTAETLEATDLGWEDSEDVALVFVRFVLDDPSDVERLEGSWIASSGACISTESSMVSSAFLAAFAATAALRQFLWALALACATHASGNQSLQTRQGLSWVQSDCPSLRRHCWQRKWLSFLRRKCEQPGNLGWDSADDDLSRDRSSAILSMQVRLERRKHTASPVTYLPKLSPETSWRASQTATSIFYLRVRFKRLGRPLVQWVIGLASVH